MGRRKRRFQAIARVVAVSALFTCALLGSLITHINLPGARRLVARLTSNLLATVFHGRLVVEAIDHMGWNAVDIAWVRVFDPQGHRIINAHGLRAEVFLPRLVAGLFSKEAILVHIPRARLREAEVLIDMESNDEGVGIGLAFLLRHAPPPLGLPEPEVPGRPSRVELPFIFLEHASVLGNDELGVPLNAEVFAAAGSLTAGSEGVTLDVERSRLVAREPAPIYPTGWSDYHLRVRNSDTGLPVLMWASFDGQMGAVAFHADARMEGTYLTGTLDVPRASPAEIHTLLPELPLREEKVSIHADIEGHLPELRVDARAVSGPGEVIAHGQMMLTAPLQMGADVTVTDLDPRSLVEGVEPASFSATGHVGVVFRGAQPIVHVKATTTATTYDGQRVPPVDAQISYDETGFHGLATVHEPGLPTDVSFFTIPGKTAVQFEAEARATELHQVPRLQQMLRGSGVVNLRGQLDADGADVLIDGQFQNAGGAGFFQMANAHLIGRLSGPLRDLDVDATLQGDQGKLGDTTVQHVNVQATGALSRPHVALVLNDERWKQLTLQADIRTQGALRIDNIRAAFREDELDVEGHVATVDVHGGSVALRGVRVDSSGGSIEGDLVLHTEGVDADFAGTLDLRRLGGVLPGARFTNGTAAFAAHLQRRGHGHDGKISIRLEDLETSTIPLRAGLGVDAIFHGTDVHAAYSGHVSSRTGPALLSLQGEADGVLQGSLFAAATWQKATGRVAVQDISLDVSQTFENELVKAAIDQDPTLPQARGKLRASLAIEKHQPEARPTSHLVVQTSNVALRIPTGAEDQGKRGNLTIEGVDGTLGITVTPVTSVTPVIPNRGESSGSADVAAIDVGLRISDERGEITVANGHTQADPLRLLHDAFVLISGSGGDSFAAAERLTSLPLQGRLRWADRAFDELPLVLRPKDVAGRFRGVLDVSGTLAEPEAIFAVHLQGVAFRNLGQTLWPMDGGLTGRFGRNRIESWGKLLHQGVEVAELSVNADAGLARLLAPAHNQAPWRVGGSLVLHGLQLEALPFLAPYGVRGRASGLITAVGLHDRPEISFDTEVRNATALGGEFSMSSLRGRLSAAGGSFVSLALQQGASTHRSEGGTLAATALAGVSFPDGWLPELDPHQTQTFSARAQNFSMESFGSLAEPVLSNLGGYLSGETTLVIPSTPVSGLAAPPRLEGQLSWREGVFVVPQLGQTFTRSHFDVETTTRGEETIVSLRDFEAAATTGRMQGNFEGTLPATYLRSILFSHPDKFSKNERNEKDAFVGRGTLRINEAQKIPITFEGTSVGDAFGIIETTVRLNRQGLDVNVNLPFLTLELPQDQNRNVQELADAPDVGLVDRKNRVDFKKKAAKPPSLPVTVHLELAGAQPGNRGGVFVRQTGINMSLRGSTVLELTDETKLRGAIEAVQGRVTVLGKPFVVERGLVRFEGNEPSNPFVEFTARWDSPDGTRVYVEAASLLKELKPFFRSDPPRSEAEVLGLVLFGRDLTGAENTLPGQRQGNAAQRAALGGASTVLNSLLDPVQVFGRRLETRVDTSSTRDARIGVATEVRPNLWAQIDVSTVSRQIRQNADVSAFTLDWRFRRNWSLRTSVGDRGSSNMDLLWQYRY